MNTRNVLNLGLLVFILVLVLLVVIEPGKNGTIIPTKLTTLQENNIKHILIQHSNSDIPVELKKENGQWLMLQPYQLTANQFRIGSINKLLSAVSLSQNDLNQLDEKNFGLNKPSATITFNKKLHIVFGHNKSLENHRYVKINSTLHMIADTFYYQLIANAESFIDHKLLPEKSKITQITLPTFKMKNNEGEWSANPAPENFSVDKANKLINEWQLSQAYDVTVNPANKTTSADVTIEFANKPTLRFKIKETKDKFTLSNIDNGVSYILTPERKNKLLLLQSESDGDGEN